MTERDNWLLKSAELLQIALAESVKLQSHYAGLLNDLDGGSRMQFKDPGEWMDRLQRIGRIQIRSEGTPC